MSRYNYASPSTLKLSRSEPKARVSRSASVPFSTLRQMAGRRRQRIALAARWTTTCSRYRAVAGRRREGDPARSGAESPWNSKWKPNMDLGIRQVDAFTDRAFAGNQSGRRDALPSWNPLTLAAGDRRDDEPRTAFFRRRRRSRCRFCAATTASLVHPDPECRLRPRHPGQPILTTFLKPNGACAKQPVGSALHWRRKATRLNSISVQTLRRARGAGRRRRLT